MFCSDHEIPMMTFESAGIFLPKYFLKCMMNTYAGRGEPDGEAFLKHYNLLHAMAQACGIMTVTEASDEAKKALLNNMKRMLFDESIPESMKLGYWITAAQDVKDWLKENAPVKANYYAELCK